MILSSRHRDALQELFNIGAGRAAAELNEMIENAIELHVPDLRVVSSLDNDGLWDSAYAESFAAVQLPFSGTFGGKALLVFASESASKLVSLLTGEDIDSPALDSLRGGTLTEVGNILLNSVMGSIANVISGDLEYRVPTYYEDVASRMMSRETTADSTIILARTRFTVASLAIEGEISIVFAVGAFEELLKAVDAIEGADS